MEHSLKLKFVGLVRVSLEAVASDRALGCYRRRLENEYLKGRVQGMTFAQARPIPCGT